MRGRRGGSGRGEIKRSGEAGVGRLRLRLRSGVRQKRWAKRKGENVCHVSGALPTPL